MRLTRIPIFAAMALALFASCAAAKDIAVRGALVHVVSGPPIRDGVVIVRDGRITAVGPASEVRVPDGMTVLSAAVVTPGLIDAHCVVGLAGYLNQPHDQDQLDESAAIQPGLRAIDSYNARERLIAWVRSFGVTTIHTGHGPGALISGQTMIAKTRGDTVEEAVFVPLAMVAATLGDDALEEEKKSPGTRSKLVALLRAELLEARDYRRKRGALDSGERGDTDVRRDARGKEIESEGEDAGKAGDDKPPDRDLHLEALGQVLDGKLRLLVTAHRHQDIVTALRVAKEFDLDLVLDGAAEGYLVSEQIRAAGVPVIVHPTMMRASDETENLSMETASKLRAAGIPIALQGGFESYVPKARVVLFEAAVAAAHGLGPEAALASITLEAAKILGIEQRVGSLEVGKDGDLALYDGDPFEYVTHCVGVVIEGRVVSDEVR